MMSASGPLIQQLEANAADPQSTGSGLGLLTLISDYGARFAWIFSPADQADVASLEICASLPISQLHH